MISEAASTVGYEIHQSQSISQSFVTRLGTADRVQLSPSALRLKEMFQEYKTTTAKRRRKQRKVADRIGFKEKDIDFRGLPDNISVVFVDPLPIPYPPKDHIVLERHYSTLPDPPRLRDPTCSYLHQYCQLDPSKLQHTVYEDQDAIFLDRTTHEPVVIVLRNFAKDYYNTVGPKASDLVLKSIEHYRSHFVLRNDSGKMATAGVSGGQRSNSLFGWVRNLKPRSDVNDHQRDISSLFGYFYALVRGRIPYISDSFERAMKDTGIPRLDPTSSKHFTLPFDDIDIKFSQHPLAPPEGFISYNFSRGIHNERHWDNCPWGVYWNLVRQHPNGQIGMDSGASFYNATYGIRVVNASNTCVVWNRSNLHGTGKYEDRLEQIGIAILLSDTTKRCWEKYKVQVKSGELPKDSLLWEPGSEDEDQS